MSATVSRRTFLAASAGVATLSSLGWSRRASAGPAPAPALQQVTMVDNTSPSIVFSPPAQWRSFANLGPNWYGGTSRSTTFVTGSFEYSNASCTRLKWWSSTKNDRGLADVYVDGNFVSTISTYNTTLTPTKVVFDSGVLPSGAHTIKVVCKTGPWLECDAIEVTEAVHETFVVTATDPMIGYEGAWTSSAAVAGQASPTVRSSANAGARFCYSLANCSRIVWLATRDVQRGRADVYLDGVVVATVDQFSATRLHQQTIFDTGALTPGGHTLEVVVRGENAGTATSPWIALDTLRVTGDPQAMDRIDGSNFALVYRSGVQRNPSAPGVLGAWRSAPASGASFGTTLVSTTQATFVESVFEGNRIRWIGGRGPDRGRAAVYIDGELVETVDAYSPTAEPGAVLFEWTALVARDFHTIRVQVLRQRAAASTGYAVDVDSFVSDRGVGATAVLGGRCMAELARIRNRTKPYLAPSVWSPVTAAARAPERGVALTGGPLRTCFDNNVRYLAHSWSKPNFVDEFTFWLLNWPTSNEARMLMGAGHALRWTDMLDPDDQTMLQAVVDTMIANATSRQSGQAAGSLHEGFALRWSKLAAEQVHSPTRAPSASEINGPMNNPGSEMANYDRAVWTRGVIAAMMSGHADAGGVLRGMGDWFNRWTAAQSPIAPALLSYSLGLQGHIASTLTYDSPIGIDADLVTAERYYVQDWWMTELARQEPLSISNYPLNRPHSYLLIGLECYLDHYRATGAEKYLAAVQGGWEMFRRDFMMAGGGTTITESETRYPAGSCDITRTNNEFDGAIFWIYLNQRLLHLFPDEEKYANEIERCIYNVALAQQDLNGNHGIRYHGLVQFRKEAAAIKNTCCEVNGTGLYSRLPEMVYSVSDDGVSIDLFAASTITHAIGGTDVTITTATEFPSGRDVSHTVAVAAPTAMRLRIRVPSWSSGAMDVFVNGQLAASGDAGTYLTLDRTWDDGDVVTYTLLMTTRLTPYTGLAEIGGYRRFALEYGPILMSFIGEISGVPQENGFAVKNLTLTPEAVLARLQPTPGDPLRLAVDGNPKKAFVPYFNVANDFTNFPVIQP